VILLPWTWPVRAKQAALALASVVLLYLCLAPARDLPGEPLWDKAEHGLAWTVLASVALLMWPARPLRVGTYAAALGGIVEILQATLPFGRDGDWRDWIADLAGIALALLAWALVRALAPRR
jgi:VanZ family protein